MPYSVKKTPETGLGGQQEASLEHPNSNCVTRGNRVGQRCGAPHTTRPETTARHLGAAHWSAVSLTQRPSGQHCHLVQNGHVLFSVPPTQYPGVPSTFGGRVAGRMAPWQVLLGQEIVDAISQLSLGSVWERAVPSTKANMESGHFWGAKTQTLGRGSRLLLLGSWSFSGHLSLPLGSPGYSALTPAELGIFLKPG